jgi:hypothetical protein
MTARQSGECGEQHNAPAHHSRHIAPIPHIQTRHKQITADLQTHRKKKKKKNQTQVQRIGGSEVVYVWYHERCGAHRRRTHKRPFGNAVPSALAPNITQHIDALRSKTERR